jgi:hypothetical protein
MSTYDIEIPVPPAYDAVQAMRDQHDEQVRKALK